MKVYKKSGKPFKSGEKINTVKNEIVNPYTGKPAFTFLEDDSIVDQYICKIVQEEEQQCPDTLKD